MSGGSEATVRREIRKGNLASVGSGPVRLSAASVHSYLQRLIAQGPVLPQGVDAEPPLTATSEAGEVEHQRDSSGRAQSAGVESDNKDCADRLGTLEEEVRRLKRRMRKLNKRNERFRSTILMLRQNQTALLDDLGAYTSPKIPNN